MNNIEYDRQIRKISINFFLEALISGTFLLLGVSFDNKIVIGLGVALFIVGILLYLTFTFRIQKEGETNEYWNNRI